MPILAKQLNLCDVSKDFDKFYYQNQNSLLAILDEFINISDYIPSSFYQRYYSHFGRNRDFSLESMLNSFLLKNLLSIPSIDLLISFLNISAEMRCFCGFLRVPNKSQFSRFKSTFFYDLNDLFNNLVDITENLAYEVNPFLASILVTDTTGFEAYVAENNPKFYQSVLRKAKAYSKHLLKDNPNSSFDAEKYAQGQLPKRAFSNADIKLAYLNGHFGYFQLHPNFSYKYFLGDAGFDADDNYAYLHNKNIMPIISLNPRNGGVLPQPGFNEFGVPLCPYDSSLPMVYDGITRHKGQADRIKYACPKAFKTTSNGKHVCMLNCDNPCTTSKFGRIKQITVNHNYRFNTSMPRDSLKWQLLYKLRTIVERSICQIKSFLQLKSSKIRNTISLKSDILIACIAQLIAFILMCKSGNYETPLAIKSLIA